MYVSLAIREESAERAHACSTLVAGAFPGCTAVVYGHTHIPQVERHKGVWILNPGSPTERRRARARAFIVLDVRRGEIVPTLVELT